LRLLISQFLTNAEVLYILPGSDIESIKNDLKSDMGKKLKLWRHTLKKKKFKKILKKKLQIQAGDTPATVRVRAGQILQKYDLKDVEKLLAKWCDKAKQVCQYFNCNCIVLLIVIVYFFHILIRKLRA
jgi:hypothetical protein